MKNIKKRGLQLIVVLYTYTLYGQVGINIGTPSAALDMVSKGNTSSTKALEINNSSGTEIITLLDDGKLGIGTSTPAYNLEAKGIVAFPDVISNVVSSSNALGINTNTGAIGIFTFGAQPIFMIGTANESNAITSSSNTGSYNMNFGSGAVPIINTIGVITGQNTGLTLNDGSSSANVSYYQFPQAGTYKIEVTGTLKCNYGTAGNFLVNMNLWKAPNNTSYTIQDDYRIVNIDGGTGIGDGTPTVARPFSQSFIMNLAANDKIAFRFYKASSSGSWSDCAMRVPTSGNQKYSMRLTVTKL